MPYLERIPYLSLCCTYGMWDELLPSTSIPLFLGRMRDEMKLVVSFGGTGIRTNRQVTSPM